MKSNPGFHECCFFKGRLCCHKGQCSVVRSEKTFWKNLTFQTYCTFERDALCQKYCILCSNIGFSKRDTAPLKGRLDMWKLMKEGLGVEGVLGAPRARAPKAFPNSSSFGARPGPHSPWGPFQGKSCFKCTLYSSKGHGVSFKGTFDIS